MIHAKNRNRVPLTQPAAVHLRRSYAECRFGQIHLWTSYPSGGGFDEHVPVVCLHHSGGSGRLFGPMLKELGTDRSVYAPDLPGHGTSDPPTARVSVTDLAASVGDFIEGLRLRTVDLFGYQLGALVAAELAIARPQQIRRVMLWGVTNYSSQERAAQHAQTRVLGSQEDGSDVADEWKTLLAHKGQGTPTSAVAEDLSDRLRAAAHGSRALTSAVDYPTAERLPLVKQPALVLRLRDEYAEFAPRVRSALPNGSLLDLPDYGQGFISAAPQRFAAVAREFLDR